MRQKGTLCGVLAVCSAVLCSHANFQKCYGQTQSCGAAAGSACPLTQPAGNACALNQPAASACPLTQSTCAVPQQACAVPQMVTETRYATAIECRPEIRTRTVNYVEQVP